MQMEKPIITRDRYWFVFVVALLLLIVTALCAFNYSIFTTQIEMPTSLIDNFVNSSNNYTQISIDPSLYFPQRFNQSIASTEVVTPKQIHDQVNNLANKKDPADHVQHLASGEKETASKGISKDSCGDEKYNTTSTVRTKRSCSCKGRYIYVHQLPRRFNDEVLNNCTFLVKWFNLCPYVTNMGLGPQVQNPEGVLSPKSWFATNQFFLEVIFRERMKKYMCLTINSSLADAIYVPFYAGFDVSRYLWGYSISRRDSLGSDLVRWLAQQPEWKGMWGRDHFFLSGRIAWDFRRQTDQEFDWGSKLMTLPEAMNLTMLSIESTSWSNEFAIPYPSYFHPSTDNEVFQWQNRMRRRKRRYLFAFAGSPRPSINDSIRGEIINQCLGSRRTCNFLSCYSGENRCDNPVEVIKVFQDSVFCLQPPGDSYTRRSTFDSILAGCIPVFFHPFSAYAQYIWHLPRNYWKYSVFIPGDLVKDGFVSIKKVLRQVSESEILEMREEVIKLIPKVIYADPRSKLETLEDAFDIALKGVLTRIREVRKDMEEGRDPAGNGFAQGNSWKMKLSGTGVEQEWDHFLE